ncbi:MAG: fibronectin type III domain-containing protein, partial [Bacteroidota bacterium]
MKRALIILITSWLLVVSGKAQDFVPYPNEDVLGWPTDAYESYIFADIPFRILFPPGFDAEGSEKYPLILFFHGAGERGTDNEKQLVHGGQLSLNAVNSGEFPGVLLYPQHNNGGGTWGPWIDRAKDVVDKLIDDYNIDPNRIYVHGLSGGGEATWRFAAFNPTYVAAMHPMSAAGSNFLEPSGVPEPYVHIPIWSSQGGNDKNPTPAEGNFMVNTIRDSWGGNIRYTYYPNSGHNTWNSQYNQPDFFTWFLEKEKTDILIRFGDGRFCEDDVINVDLGVTPGFDNYEWTLNDTTSTVIASGSMSNEINVTDTGRYYVRFQRGTEWTKWSKPAHINRNRPPSTEPIISAGLQSVNLPGLDGSQSVTFSGPADKDSYQWFLNGSVLPGAVQPELTVGTAGQYALSIQEPGGSGVEADGITPTEFRADPQGCPSELSPSITVTTSNGVNVPARPSNFFVNAVSSNTIVVNWDDNASNELGFELYRSTSSGSNYSLIAKVDATNESNNPQQYVDSNLTPNTTYYYRLRAVNNDGGSAYTNEVNATTDVDSESPSAPILSLAQTTQNSISLTWTASNDNSGIAGYDIFRDNSFIGNVDGDILNFTNTGLPLGEFFTYTVRARDLSGNTSIQSNQVSGVTVNSGLSYRYYHHNNLSTVDDIEANGTFIESGTTNNFDITLRTQDNRFAFIWDGYILIQTAGDYTFYTDSDDGSKLFINGQQIVNNDGTHGCIEKNGVITLAEGFAEIQVRMFDNGGGECLTVEWQGPGISKENIPDDILYENPFSTPVPPSAPIVLNATSIDFQQIDLSWTDTSSDETGFEIYRSLSSSGGFQLVRVTAANETTWSDSGLNGETTYYYLINSINLNGSSETVGPASATTLSAPSAPSAPSGLTLQALSSTSVKVDWTDNSSDETGFELYRTTVDPGVTIDDDYVLTLDGSNDYVAIDNFFYNSSGLSELTVETWIKTSDGSNQVICSFDRNEYFRLEIDGSAADAGRIGFGIFTNGGQIDLGGSTRVDDGNWHHVAATYVNGVASIYVDGVLDASLSQGTTFGTGNIRYGFIGVGSEATSFDGSRGPTDYFNGELDEFRIWSVGRSQTEVSENRFVSLVGSEPGLQTYYRITESSGPTIADATATGATGFLRDDVAFSQINPSLVELNSFTLIHTSSADATSYTDNSVYGNNTYYYRVRAFGAGGNSAYTSVENVTTPNLPPVIDEIIDRSVKFDTSLDVDIIANDPDGDAISLSFDVALPSFATFQDNGYGIGRITFNPTSEDQGSYPLTVTADDGSGGLDTESFIITVSDNDNPTIVAIPNQLLEEGFASSVNVSVTDPQTQAAISITADNLPAFANFVDNGNGQGTIAFSSGIGDAGFYPNIRIVASDGEGGFSEEFFNLTVNEVDPFFSLQINFSTSASTGPSPWNNFVTTNNGISNLVSNEGVTTDVGLQTFDATNAKFNEAYIADLADGVYPNDVLETFWFKFGGTVVMRLQNLNPSLFYDLSFFAGVNDDFERQSDGPTLGAQKRTRITVDGNVQTIDFANNNSNLLQFTGIQPDLNGEIVIQVTKPNGSVPYFVLNALVVDAYFNNGLAPEAPDNLNLTATSSSEVNVQWADNSNNETRFEIYRSDVSESGPFVLAGNAALNSTSFLDTNLTGSTLYYYKVRAVNVNGFGETGIGLVTTLNSPPTITTINDVTLSSNSNLILPVSATDLEDNTIFLTSINLPDFITFLDNGDGTGAFTFNPTSTDANFNGSITLEAIDNFGSNSSASFFVTVTDDQFSEVIYINFDLNSMASNPWNNLEANPNSQPSYSNLLTGTGNPSTVGLTVNSGWSGVADDGLTSGNNTFAYPDDVVRSYWYTTGTASMTITGLVPGTYYNIDLLATTDQWIYTNSDYSLGSLTKSISATNNGDEIEFFSSLLADGSGEIDITINALTNAQRAFINAIVIKRADSSIPISPKELLANGISQSQISLSWEDNSNNETGFEIYRSNGPGEIFTLINTTAANETSYLDGGHQKNTAYIYKIRAVNANGNSAYSNESTAITIDQRILVNINASISGFDQAPAPWNNTNAVPEDGTVFSNFLNESGQVTSVGLELQTWSSGQTNNSGFQTGDDSGIYPDEVLQGYYYLNDFESADLLLNNLNDSLVYDLHFFGTENGTFTPAAGPGIADFSSGTVTETLFTEFNTVETVVLEDLAPTANGSIP